MSLDINFNHNWSCCRYTAPDDDDTIVTATITNVVGDLDWSPVKLPHVASIEKRSPDNNKLAKWWYRKQFQWSLLNQQEMQPIYLTLKSLAQNTEEINDAPTTSIFAVLWLDAIKIFSGFLTLPKISVELLQILLNSDQMNSYNHEHTLIVYCMNGCLSFNAFLTVPYDSICGIREIQLNTTAENTIDERVDVASNSTVVPLLTIVMLIIGTRGDVQPFIA